MSANVEADGQVKQLDRRPEPDENITEATVKEPARLARLLLKVFRDVAALKRRWAPKQVTIRGQVSTGVLVDPQRFRFAHQFGGRVDYWLTRVTAPTGADNTLVVEVDETDENTLVVDVYFPATFDIRIQEAG